MADSEPDTGGPVEDLGREDLYRPTRALVSSLREGIAGLGPACHRDVPDFDGVVLTAFAARAGWIILSDSGPGGDQLEDLHTTLGEGPRVAAAATGLPVTVADLDHSHARMRWPRFAPQALASGIRAVFAFPIVFDQTSAGVLSAYRGIAGPLSAADREQISQYAHIALILLFNDALVNGVTADTPLTVEAAKVQQAVGMVMEYATVDAVTALHRLRAYAHHSGRAMRHVVAEIRTGHLPFDPTTPA